MTEKLEAFWDALGALTFAETIEVAEALRDAWDATLEPDTNNVQMWAFLLNTAREIATAEEDA